MLGSRESSIVVNPILGKPNRSRVKAISMHGNDIDIIMSGNMYGPT